MRVENRTKFPIFLDDLVGKREWDVKYVTLEGCPYFTETERIDFYAEASARKR